MIAMLHANLLQPDLDPLTRMKNFLHNLEKDMALPETFKYVEGTTFIFMGKKLNMNWSGEKLGGIVYGQLVYCFCFFAR